MNTAKEGYLILPGSHKAAPAAKSLDTLNPNAVMDVTIRVRRKASIEGALKAGKQITQEAYEKQFGASQEDMDSLEQFIGDHHLTIVETSLARRSMIVRGRVKDFEEAFGVILGNYRSTDGETFRGRSGGIMIPKSLEGLVEGIFGLDNRPQARPMFQVAHEEHHILSHAAVPAGYYPNEVANLYGFPSDVNGKGQCIAIIELGGGYKAKDLTTYFNRLNINKPSVTAISVDGAHNNPTNANSADGEVLLDIEVAGAVAPGAKIVVYFAPNTDKGFLDAITSAIHDTKYKPSVISISWGGPEKSWTQASLTTFNEAFKAASLLGVTITVASGDSGSSDGMKDGKVHVDFPASSPFVLACGGTKLLSNGSILASESVWHAGPNSASGGGVSDFFPLPDFQAGAGVPVSLNGGFKGRGVPDVAGNADPATGYKVLVDGVESVIGGTSAVAPLMAGFIALMNQKTATRAGFINPKLYANHAALCRDITVGDNITTSTNLGFKAKAGWDACTGYGVLNKL
jgi:kumamolisin